MKQALKNRSFRERVLVRPQSLQLTDVDGQLELDFVARYESLQSDFDEICQRIDIPGTSLARRNVSRHEQFADYYDDELQEAVADFYRQDLELFDYRFPDA